MRSGAIFQRRPAKCTPFGLMLLVLLLCPLGFALLGGFGGSRSCLLGDNLDVFWSAGHLENYAAILGAAFGGGVRGDWIGLAEPLGGEAHGIDAFADQIGSPALGPLLRKMQVVFGGTRGVRVALDLDFQFRLLDQ